MMLMLQNETLMTQYVVFYDGIKLVYIYSSPSEKKTRYLTFIHILYNVLAPP